MHKHQLPVEKERTCCKLDVRSQLKRPPTQTDWQPRQRLHGRHKKLLRNTVYAHSDSLIPQSPGGGHS